MSQAWGTPENSKKRVGKTPLPPTKCAKKVSSSDTDDIGNLDITTWLQPPPPLNSSAASSVSVTAVFYEFVTEVVDLTADDSSVEEDWTNIQKVLPFANLPENTVSDCKNYSDIQIAAKIISEHFFFSFFSHFAG